MQTSPDRHPAAPGVQLRTQVGLAEATETQSKPPAQSEPLHDCPSVFRGWFSIEHDETRSKPVINATCRLRTHARIPPRTLRCPGVSSSPVTGWVSALSRGQATPCTVFMACSSCRLSTHLPAPAPANRIMSTPGCRVASGPGDPRSPRQAGAKCRALHRFTLESRNRSRCQGCELNVDRSASTPEKALHRTDDAPQTARRGEIATVSEAGSRFKRHSAFTEALHPCLSDNRDYVNYVAYFPGM